MSTMLLHASYYGTCMRGMPELLHTHAGNVSAVELWFSSVLSGLDSILQTAGMWSAVPRLCAMCRCPEVMLGFRAVIDIEGGFNKFLAAAYELKQGQTVKSAFGAPFGARLSATHEATFLLAMLSMNPTVNPSHGSENPRTQESRQIWQAAVSEILICSACVL